VSPTTPLPTLASSAGATPGVSPSAAGTASPSFPVITGEKIVFYRTDDARANNTPFMIDPDGSHEIQLAADIVNGVWSQDRRKLAIPAGGDWARPALVHADGSGFQVLDAYPGRKIQLGLFRWSADGSRLIVSTGGADQNADPTNLGLFSIRSTDGGDLTPLVRVPAGSNQAFWDFSPDGTRLLMSTIVPQPGQPDSNSLFVVNADGSGQRQISPPDSNLPVIDLQFFDGTSEAWAPNGSLIAFCVQVLDVHKTAMYVVRPDGTGLKRIVPPSMGAISVRFAPNGKLIAFTSEVGPENQIWTVHPDGSGLKQLTNGKDGSVSIVPVWSPDGSKLLFQRKQNGHVTLWTMNADGTDQMQLSSTPLASDWIGPYSWWPAPG
jgi:WD40 repeat protein